MLWTVVCLVAFCGILHPQGLTEAAADVCSSAVDGSPPCPAPVEERAVMFAGLLSNGSSPVSMPHEYSTNMDCAGAASLLESNRLVEALFQDHFHRPPSSQDLQSSSILRELADDVHSSTKAAHAFMLSAEVWGREQLTDTLQALIEDQGHMALLLGGQDVGKSVVLQSLCTTNEKVLCMDFRASSDMVAVLFEGLKTLEQPWLRAANNVLQKSTAPIDMTSVSRILGDMLSGPELAGHTLIFDHAHLALGIDANSTNEDLISLRGLLAVLVKHTKQDRKINVIFASSDSTFLHQLAHPALGLSRTAVWPVIVMDELPPHRMAELLTTRWGLGEHLAAALVGSFGGHVLQVSQVLEHLLAFLRMGRATVPVQHFLPTGVTKDITACLHEAAQLDAVYWPLSLVWSPSHTSRMEWMLRALAEQGYAHLQLTDTTKGIDRTLAEVIVSRRLGHLLPTHEPVVLGLPAAAIAYEQEAQVLVVNSQYIRMAIVKVLG